MDNNNELIAIYDQLCTSYHSVDDFRAKLLGFLPLVSGIVIFELLGKAETTIYLAPIGFFGVITTLGLLIYELKGIQKCTGYIEFGFQIEKSLLKTPSLHLGHFGSLKTGHKITNAFTEPVASAFVYGAVIGAWTYVATCKSGWAELSGINWPAIVALAVVWAGVVGFWKLFSKPVLEVSQVYKDEQRNLTDETK